MNALSRTRRLPPLNALRAFEAAARHLNFRLAADELGVTQGAVAQQVRHLEDVVDVQLFRRLPRGLALTRGGLEYFSSVQRALQIISDATDALGERPTVLAVSTTPSFASKWLIPRLADFSRLHPDIEVRVIADERLATFRADGVDIAIRLSKPPFPPGLVAQLLFPLDVFAVASPALLDGGAPIRKPADLSKHVLLHDAHDLWPEFIGKLGGKGRADPTKGPRFSQSLLAIDAAVAGQGIALTSEPLVERDITEGRLRRVFDFSFPMSLGFYVVFPQANAESYALGAMRQWLFAQYGNA
ncbi:transcriptional regulator GcvA [Burkholderia sp. AU28942]|uniref:transcriptional regulator GcvA n=1 Tax=Burkholderia TaxID=32008 RepID=UPI000841AA8D|nr:MULTISPECIES: transcriptional regulator GcvA [Burkholderia]AOK07924.1 LysR family transcriptional regulator [Burkholderia latens]MCA8312132.1 transcriptional regulator GcvA [Burkholderia sp. AU28942]QTO50555.1 transcriptional regulator GcvA [Burkholderia latens]